MHDITISLELCASDHDTDSLHTDTYPFWFLTKVLMFVVLQLVSSLQNNILIFHTMTSVWV